MPKPYRHWRTQPERVSITDTQGAFVRAHEVSSVTKIMTKVIMEKSDIRVQTNTVYVCISSMVLFTEGF